MVKHTVSDNKLQQFKSQVEGRTIFILGGGASVTASVLARLNSTHARVICLNSSVKFIETPMAVMWSDDSWAARNKTLLDKLNCFKISSMAYNSIPLAPSYASNDMIWLNKTGEFGMDYNINCVKGNNTGAHAINLVVNCNAATVGLVGFDMNANGSGATHFHNEYKCAVRPSTYLNRFIPSIVSMANQIKEAGMRTAIYNCNQFSSLPCFEFKSLRDMT